MKETNEIFWDLGSVFSDERLLKLPADKYRAKVSEQIDRINSTLSSIENF